MKIALFTDTFDDVNGVTNTFHKLVEYCKNNKKHLEILTLSNKDSITKTESVIIHRFKPRLPIPLYQTVNFDLNIIYPKIITYFKKNKFDLIHTATPGNMGLMALLISKIYNTPLVGSYHTSLPEYVKLRIDKIVKKLKWFDKKASEKWENATWRYMKWYYDQCKLVLVPSYYTKKQLEKKFNTKIEIFSRGIDTNKFNPKYKKKKKQLIALYVGRISIEKNLDILVKCFKNRKDVKLIVVGDGPYKKEMMKLFKNAIFTGFIKGKRLSQIYASSDFFIFPSTTDTFGNVVLEAMSSGLPVIVSNKMGPKELVIHGKNGYISSLENLNHYVDLLVKNSKLRNKLGKNARKYALTRDWNKIFDKLFKDYKSVLI